MLDTPCYEVVWKVLATHSIRQFPLHFPSRASPCAITFQLDSTSCFPQLMRNYTSCVPEFLLHLHQLRPEFSTPSVTSCIAKWDECANCPTIWRVSQFYCSLCYTQLCAHTQNSWLTATVHSVVISRYCLLLHRTKKIFAGMMTDTLIS
jgi:hypothetical protein